MKLVRDLTELTLDKPSALSIGVFDGVHLGHRYLMDRLMESAQSAGLLTGVVTFDSHPDELLAPLRHVRYLTTLTKKLNLLGGLGLDLVMALPFTSELAQTSARGFILSLVQRLHMRELWIGPDFALGRGREGNATYLSALGREIGFRLEALEPLTEGGEVISSSRIRALLGEGKVTEASQLLGRYLSIEGQVVSGAKRGQRLGFPTANLAVDEKIMIPADGIYAVRVQWGATNHQGVVNVGVRPTFEDQAERIVEAHIIDFTGDLYGKTLEIRFIRRLRPEQRFDNADALVAQMRQDVTQTRRLFRELEP